VLLELPADVEVGQHVAVEHQEALVEQTLGELQRAAGAQRPRLLHVAQPHPNAAPSPSTLRTPAPGARTDITMSSTPCRAASRS
jgi:hypothetical protein